MNGNGPAKHPELFDHEVRLTRAEVILELIRQDLQEFHTEQKALRESLDRNMEALRQEFHRDRRFSALVFLTTQLAVIGALLRLAGVF